MKMCLQINIKHIATCKSKCTLMTLDLGVKCDPLIFRVLGMIYGMESYDNHYDKIWILIIGQVPNHVWRLLVGMVAVVLPM